MEYVKLSIFLNFGIIKVNWDNFIICSWPSIIRELWHLSSNQDNIKPNLQRIEKKILGPYFGFSTGNKIIFLVQNWIKYTCVVPNIFFLLPKFLKTDNVFYRHMLFFAPPLLPTLKNTNVQLNTLSKQTVRKNRCIAECGLLWNKKLKTVEISFFVF